MDIRSLLSASDPPGSGGYPPTDPREPAPRYGFFTDTTVCIGCKACEVACKEWNQVPEDGLNFTGMSYDNTAGLGADTWRHVAFIEQRKPLGAQQANRPLPVDLGLPTTSASTSGPASASGAASASGPAFTSGAAQNGEADSDFRWLMSSDVCKHCTHAACLDVCPTGALFRTEFGTVVVQEDVCNGCGYCVPACPYGVIDQRKGDGRVWKCTLCYDRVGDGLEPACAKTCPTNSIQFGELAELHERAQRRVEQLHEAGITDARLYGEDPNDGVGGTGAFFLLLDKPEVYGLPPDPVVTTRDLPAMWRNVGIAATAMLATLGATFLGARR